MTTTMEMVLKRARALIADFSMLWKTNVFHSDSTEWWLEFFGGPYVYPGFDECAETHFGLDWQPDYAAYPVDFTIDDVKLVE